MKLKKTWLLPIACYGLAVLLYLGGCTFALVRDSLRYKNGQMAETALSVEEFNGWGFAVLEEKDGRERFVSLDGDPQLYWPPLPEEGEADSHEPFYVGTLRLDGENNWPTGEIVLFYTTKPGEEFSDGRRVWANRTESGWQFDLYGKKVYRLRLDPDDNVHFGVMWELDGITLNAPKSAGAYFAPDATAVFLLLALPGLAAALLREVVQVLVPVYGQWREKRPRKNA